ncbi:MULTISPECIES: DUF2304 domain-containing protein [Cellulomonas]|jgi:hypothetical protein|uniref:DUF2304 domain-containing protein n=1 Tax=Cellulomonas TaxID=1707 RepID=UPI00062597FC|nr:MULTISPECIES: DUF2304 domain-containing protein [Cellulomonas]
MSGYVFALVLCVAVLALLVQLLRTRRIREKYAAIWIFVAVAISVLGAFPHVVFWLADVVGVQTPVNLLFALAALVLLAVCLQLSGEISTLEEKTRTLAEEVALLQLQQRRLEERTARRDADEPDAVGTDDGAHG